MILQSQLLLARLRVAPQRIRIDAARQAVRVSSSPANLVERVSSDLVASRRIICVELSQVSQFYSHLGFDAKRLMRTRAYPCNG
jgi:hypothetical protein